MKQDTQLTEFVADRRLSLLGVRRVAVPRRRHSIELPSLLKGLVLGNIRENVAAGKNREMSLVYK